MAQNVQIKGYLQSSSKQNENTSASADEIQTSEIN